MTWSPKSSLFLIFSFMKSSPKKILLPDELIDRSTIAVKPFFKTYCWTLKFHSSSWFDCSYNFFQPVQSFAPQFHLLFCFFFLLPFRLSPLFSFDRVKLHYAACAASAAKIICQGTRFARTLTYTMMRISQTIGDPHSALWNHRAAGVYHHRASSSDTISHKPRRSGCAAGVTWRLWNYMELLFRSDWSLFRPTAGLNLWTSELWTLNPEPLNLSKKKAITEKTFWYAAIFRQAPGAQK